MLLNKLSGEEMCRLTTRLLVSATTDAGVEGGLYYVDLENNEYHRILSGDFRGIDICGDLIYAVSLTFGITVLDRNLNIVGTIGIGDYDFHGFRIYKGEYALITETSRDAVGIYSFPDFKRIREIRITDSTEDHHHINDLQIIGDSVLISMFSQSGSFKTPSFNMDGAILEYDIPTGQFRGVAKSGQRYPHSILETDGEFRFCGSLDMNLSGEKEPLAQFNGFTRGLARDGKFFFVGQSLMRHLELVTDTHNNISMDAGFHIFDSEKHTSRFVSLPARQVYEIVLLEKTGFSLGSAAKLNEPGSVKNLPDPDAWNAREENSRWMKEKTADIRLFADTPARSVVIEAISGYPGPLQAIVYANRFPIGTIVWPEPGYRQARLPLPAALSGEVIITLETDRIWSPCEVSETRDIRKLGIAVSSVALSEDAAEVPDMPAHIQNYLNGGKYEGVGSEADFTDRSSEKCLLKLSQWHEFESRHRWMSEGRVDLVLRTEEPASLLTISAESSCPEKISCKVFVNRFLAGTLVFEKPGIRSVVLHLPGSITGIAEITLETDRVWRPCDVSDTTDERTLGIALVRLSLGPDPAILLGSGYSGDLGGDADNASGDSEDNLYAEYAADFSELSSEKHLSDLHQWHGLEAEHRWMAGDRADLVLYTRTPANLLRIKAESSCPEPISCKVYVNRFFVGSVDFTEPGGRDVSFKLPGSVTGPAEITLETDRVWRPCDFSDIADERTLGIAVILASLTGNETPHARRVADESSGPAKESRVIADIHLGDLSSEQFLTDLTEWNDREPEQRWVAKSQANLSIPVTEPVRRLKIKAFSDYPGVVTCKVFANGAFVADMVFPDAGPGEYDMLLPETVADMVRIRLETDRIWRPCKVFNSHDERLLGIAIVSASLAT